MGIVRAFDLLPYTGRLLVPGEPPLEGETLFMAVSNNRFAGGGFEVGPLARSDDGLLDFASVRLPRPLDLAQFARELSDPTAEENEFVHYRQLSEFVVEADRKLHWNLDGEPVLRRRMRFRVLPGELDVGR